MFDYGFENYKAEPLATEGETLCRLPVSGGLIPFCPVVAETSLTVCLAPGETVRRELKLGTPALFAPVSAGSRVGEAIYYLNEKEISRIPLVAGASITNTLAPKQRLLDQLRERLSELSG